jgi:inorganic pyrophosphatase
VLITQYYTDFNFTPVQRIAEASKTGHGTNVIAGMAVGMESTFLPAICISIALIAAYYMGLQTGITTVNSSGGTDSTYAGIFGTACATMGMLSTASYILAMDTFGPIADNAGGIAEMSQQPDEVRVITDRLDAVGNTTKALTKGYAIGSASLATFLLFRSFLDLAKGYYAPTISANATYSMLGLNVPLPALLDEIFAVDFSVPEIFIGGLLGAAVVMLFSSFAMRAVGVAAQAVVVEVRRQFQMFPGIMDFSQKPDYTTCVSIVAESALREMIKPGLLVVLTPVVVGLTFRVIGIIRGQPANNPFVGARNDILGALTVAGLLMIGTITGIMMALNLNNAGGAWDNAKKFIEIQGNKGSDQHKSAVTGDTVGDPCKDTAGPSIHVLIKLLATVTLVLAPIFVTSRN